MWRRWLAVLALGTMLSVWPARAESLRSVDHAVQPAPVKKQARLKAHPVVALTFDDMPAAGDLEPNDTRVRIATALSSVLKAHGLKGVYGFVNASDMEGDSDAQEALRIWVRSGMNIGSHTWSHPSLSDVTAEAYIQDIARNEPVLAEYGKRHDWRWFRYPYLEEGDTLEKRNMVRTWLRQHHYRIAQVTLNFDDDAWDDPYHRCMVKHDDAGIAWLKQSYLQNAAEYLRVGREEEQIAFGREVPNVLLLHETAFTTLMLPDLLEILQKQGFRFETLPKVERNRVYSMDPGATLKDGGTLPNQFLDSRHLPYPPSTPEPYDKLDSLCK